MNITNKRMNQIEELDIKSVQELLQTCAMEEFVDFVKEKEIDGRKLMVSNSLHYHCKLQST